MKLKVLLAVLTFSPSLFAASLSTAALSLQKSAAFNRNLSMSSLGGSDRGGGDSVVCRDASGRITSAQLLDLFEAQNLLGLDAVVAKSAKSYLDIAVDAARRIDAGGGGENRTSVGTVRTGDNISVQLGLMPRELVGGAKLTEDNVRGISGKIKLLSAGVGLAVISDYNTVILPRDCGIEQTAVYLDSTDKILVVSDIWNVLDNTNKAALLVHEAVYLQLRQNGEINSDRARLAVGHAFGGDTFVDVASGIPADADLCFSQDADHQFRFALLKTSSGQYVFQFLRMGGENMLTKTTFFAGMPPASDTAVMMNTLNSVIDKDVKMMSQMTVGQHGQESISIGFLLANNQQSDLVKIECAPQQKVNFVHLDCKSLKADAAPEVVSFCKGG